MPDPVADFITKWSNVQATEKSISQSFLLELCDVLGVERPAGADDYKFEKEVVFVQHGEKRTTKFIDLYRRGRFVLESKKYAGQRAQTHELGLDFVVAESPPTKKAKITRGTGQWDDAMLKAYDQAERYAHHLPGDEPNPVFLLVVDVGHVFELFADFSQKGKAYLPFPDARSHRLPLALLAKPDVRDLLRTIWLDPQSLDPTRRTVAVTLKVARHLAALAKSFEETDSPKLVAEFLTRCLFCMFAEDVGLLPKDSFRHLLDSIKSPGQFAPLVSALFKEMDSGTGESISLVLRQKLLRFNGGIFSDPRGRCRARPRRHRRDHRQNGRRQPAASRPARQLA